MATFYGIGVGPGDSELMTVKAVNTLKKRSTFYTRPRRTMISQASQKKNCGTVLFGRTDD